MEILASAEMLYLEIEFCLYRAISTPSILYNGSTGDRNCSAGADEAEIQNFVASHVACRMSIL